MTTSSKLKTYAVGYWMEAGFTVNVQATGKRQALRIIAKMLDEECDQLPNSDRVHYDGGMTGDAILVKP